MPQLYQLLHAQKFQSNRLLILSHFSPSLAIVKHRANPIFQDVDNQATAKSVKTVSLKNMYAY